jgi:hypothetical protein
MVEVKLDAVASSINFIAGVFLAIDALTAPWKAKVVRGWEILYEGIKKRKTAPKDLLADPDGKPSNSSQSGANWADRRTRKLALIGFLLLAGGFALDIFSKVVCNPLLFTK